MVDPQSFGQVALGQVGSFSHFSQKGRQLAVTLCRRRSARQQIRNT
jgi:hypothetical protein